MSNLDDLLARNRTFAAQQVSAGTLMPSLAEVTPKLKATIIGCADMRVDPAHVLGLLPGEAGVLRNIGGRITPGLVQELGLLGKVGQAIGKAAGGGGEYHVIVLQHTDCGITRLAEPASLLAPFFQIPEAEVAAKAVLDPRAAVAMDVAILRAIPTLPAKWLLSGLVYDVATGLIEVVVPAAPVRAD